MVTGGRLNVGRLVESLASDPTVPLPPSGLNASDGSTLGSVRVAWGSSLFAESYTLWRNGTDDASTATIIADDLTATSYQDTAADVDETYYYWVSATNDLGTSSLSNSDSGFYSPSRSPNDAFVDRATLVSATNQLHQGRTLMRQRSWVSRRIMGLVVAKVFGGLGPRRLQEMLKSIRSVVASIQCSPSMKVRGSMI
jgi:hypothetical protein